MGTLLLEFTKIESHLPTIMMPSHGHNQVHLVPANKIFCLLFSFSVAIKYEKRDLEDLLKLEVNLKRVFNQLTLCHVIVIVSMLHNIFVSLFKKATASNKTVALMLIPISPQTYLSASPLH